MKKELGLFFTLLAIGTLAGCTNQKDQETSQASTAETTATTMVESTQTQKSSQSETSQSSASTSQAVSEDSSNTSSTTDIYSQIQAVFPDLVLPKDVPLASGKVLNAATAGSQSDASILYYGLDQQLSLNDKALNEETPLAAFQSKEYQSADEAAAAVNVTADDGGQAVDLGYGITGHMQGAAGSSYLSWQEGNWSLTVRAVNQEEQDPVPVAKEVVAYLEEAMLPAPEVGQITIDMGKNDHTATTVVWQQEKMLRTAQHQDARSALEMAVSMNQ
ncbi:hypothetical protein P7I46_11540 [Enterococcus casseliflavus]|uniref:hypothetical protein n=1 Tax=Enterococcus casseliflavus TaxID=37734 RepID=UPI00288EE5AB|nr:hypothetical protein [Enterococcus casseliflavus]MDT2955270.1 hypothetical protein [Enterococcus casseliflavus]MDT2958582.1 hypothetical protein [Enterococcus casseliflavus]